MNKLNIHLLEARVGFRPGEVLRGTAEWQLGAAPIAIEVRLCWLVRVQGIAETRRMQTLRFDRPAASEKRNFEFTLPDGPYSYSGTLSRLDWAIELVVLPGMEFTDLFFHLGPGSAPLSLHDQLPPDVSPRTVDSEDSEENFQ
jgi:hypothetical protein